MRSASLLLRSASLLLVLPVARAGLFDLFGGRGSSSSPRTAQSLAQDPTIAPWFRAGAWTGLNASERADRWFELSPKLGINCPKVGIGYFWYPSLGAKLRGAAATQNIMRGEEVCAVPVDQMLSEFSVGNSSLRDFMYAYAKGALATVSMKAAMAIFVIREGAKTSSPYIPYIRAMLDGHDPDPIPATWVKGDPRLQKLSAYGQKLAAQARARALRQYTAMFPAALARFRGALADGVACKANPCAVDELQALYSSQRFVEVYSVLRARDWVLDMHGEERPFLAPTVDLLNFGQVGIRASYDNKRAAFVARTVQPIKKGAELLFYYGNFCYDDAIRCAARPNATPNAQRRATPR